MLSSGGGWDRLEGGAGYDRYSVSDGDTLSDTDGQGQVLWGSLRLAGGIRLHSTDAYYTGGMGEKYTLLGNVLSVSWGKGYLQIENWTNGQLGIGLGMAMQGSAGADTLQGGAGSDVLTGGEGADVYRFGKSSGRDRIAEGYSGTTTGRDTVVLGYKGTALGTLEAQNDSVFELKRFSA